MSVKMKPQTGRFAGRTVPVLMPLYRTDFGSWQFTEDGDYRCGSAAHCDIQIEADGISSEHCALAYHAGHLSVRRGNGRVWVNELPVHNECTLSPGDTLSFGAISFRIDSAEPARQASITAEAPVAAVPATPAFAVPPAIPAPAPYVAPLMYSQPAAVVPPPIPTIVTVTDSSELQEKLRAVAEQKSSLDARERQLQDAALACKEREQALAERQKALDDRSALLTQQRASVSEQMREISDQQTSLSTLEQSLRKQKSDLDRKVRQLDERELDLDSQSERNASLYSELERGRLEVQQQADRLKSKEAELVSERQRIEALRQDADRARATNETELQDRATAIEAREQLLNNHTAELEQKYALLQSELARLEALRDEVANREQDCLQRDARSRAFSEELGQKVQQLSERAAAIDEHSRLSDTRTRELDARIESFQQFVASTEETLHLREVAVQQDRESLAQRDNEHAATRLELEQLRAEIEQTRQSLNDRETLLNERTAALDAQVRQMLEQARSSEDGAVQAATVEQMAALHAERETLMRVRQEVLDSQSDLRRQEAALASRSSELDGREAALAGKYQAIEQAESELQSRRSELESSSQQLSVHLADARVASALKDELAAQAEILAADQNRLSEERSELAAWKHELDVRAEELAARLTALKAHRRALSSSASEAAGLAPAASDEQLNAREDELRRLQLELMERQSALELEQQRLTLERDLARQQTLAAESEREALQVAHKALLCERNSVSQSVQDLKTREQVIRDLEAKLNRQSDDIASRIVAVEHQVALLRSRENELESRSAALHRNVQDFKLEMAEQRRRQLSDYVSAPEGEDTVPKDTQLTELADLLHTAERQRDGVTAERDAMLAAVRELQKALTDARDDVEEAAKLRSEVTRQSQELSKLYTTLEEKNAQLQISEARIAQEEEKVTALSLRLCQSGEGTAVSSASYIGDADDAMEARLLAELESVRAELAQATQGDGTRLAELQQAVTERNRLISDLQEELERLRRQTGFSGSLSNEAAPSGDSDQLKTQLAEQESALKEREEIIRELQARLKEQTSAEPAGRDSLIFESKELDRRASVLDDRDEELRERQRKLEQSEDEVEQQRRQLLEARQQLEQARAEVQMAMRQHATHPPVVPATVNTQVVRHDTIVDEPAHDFSAQASVSSQGETPVSGGEESGASALRAELAALFGIGKSSESDKFAPPPIPEYVDTSEPAGKAQAVSLSFGTDASAIVSAPTSNEADEMADESEAESEDFVKDYMEQLLARSRKSAGTTLPQELKGDSRKKSGGAASKSSSAAAKQETPKLPKVTSFIEQYMANGYGEVDSAAGATAPSAEAASSPDNSSMPSTPRQKMDLQKLRENMDSFRSLSTQSVEKAIVHSTLKRERHNINGRIMLSVVLGTMTVFLAIANFKGVINHVVAVWIALAATIISVAELVRKMSQIRSKCRETLQPDAETRAASKRISESSAPEVNSSEGVADKEALSGMPALANIPALSPAASHPGLPASAQSRHEVQSGLHTSSIATSPSADAASSHPERLLSGQADAGGGATKQNAGVVPIHGVESLSAAEELLRSIAQQGTQASPATAASAKPRFISNDNDEESQYFEL